MASRGRTACHCSRSLYLSPAVLFLFAILPSSSFAQLTDPSSSPPSNTATSLSNTTPNTFQTSTTFPSPTSNPSPTTTQSNAPASTTISDDGNGRNPNGMFNYYFVIVAVVVVLFVIAMLYIGKRKKQKANILRSNSQRALAQDVEGLRNRFGMGRGAMRRAHAGGGVGQVQRIDERTEGLNERGEAPPPYNPGSKPPSIRSNDGIAVRDVAVSRPGTRDGQMVELNTIDTQRQDPPGYHEETDRNTNNAGNESWADLDMARPAPTVTAPPRRDISTE